MDLSKIKYIVIENSKMITSYQSLRDISAAIKVDSSTISKKLSRTGECFCKSKSTNKEYFIQKFRRVLEEQEAD
jgi:NADH/NAD ratio-sensing transcriptional regulator Rex